MDNLNYKPFIDEPQPLDYKGNHDIGYKMWMNDTPNIWIKDQSRTIIIPPLRTEDKEIFKTERKTVWRSLIKFLKDLICSLAQW